MTHGEASTSDPGVGSAKYRDCPGELDPKVPARQRPRDLTGIYRCRGCGSTLTFCRGLTHEFPGGPAPGWAEPPGAPRLIFPAM